MTVAVETCESQGLAEDTRSLEVMEMDWTSILRRFLEQCSFLQLKPRLIYYTLSDSYKSIN